MTAKAAPGPGETVGGYRIEALLGRGGMGAVYLATHERLRRKVALKLLAPDLADDEAFRARFLRESELAASLDHPNVIPIYDAGEVGGVLYLAMRYIDGPSLQRLVRERGSLPVAQTASLTRQIAGALDAAHETGLVHRDVKPANILLAGPNEHAYLCDFGLAKHRTSSGITAAGWFLGTVDFSSPEQIEGRPLDGRADLYSLGCVAFNCLTGQPPFVRESEIAVLQAHLNAPAPSVTALRPELPGAVADVIATALAKDPAARYPTGAGFADALASATAGGETTRPAPALRRPGRRGLAVAAALLAAVLVVAAVTTVLAMRGSSGAEPPASLGTFVDRVENILVQSSAGRAEIADTLAAASKCTISPEEASRRIASVGENRQSIVQQLGALPAPTDEAARLVTLLQRGLQQSIEADRHYRDAFAAAGAPGPGCTVAQNEDFRLAAQASARATAAKRRFVAGFDPLAIRYGQRTWSAGDF